MITKIDDELLPIYATVNRPKLSINDIPIEPVSNRKQQKMQFRLTLTLPRGGTEASIPAVAITLFALMSMPKIGSGFPCSFPPPCQSNSGVVVRSMYAEAGAGGAKLAIVTVSVLITGHRSLVTVTDTITSLYIAVYHNIPLCHYMSL
jgi:hypothetical protein